MVSIGTISYLGSHGTELLRAGWTESVLDPGIADWVRRIHEFGREADTADLRRRRVRLEDKGAIVAFHWRGAPDEEGRAAAIDATRRRGGGGRACDALGAQGARGAAAGEDGQGRRDHNFLEGADVDAVAVRRRRRDRPRRVPALTQLKDERAARLRGPRRRPLR